MAAVWLDSALCTGCGACIEVCPTGALRMVEGHVQVDEALCTGCATCINICPVSALKPVLEIDVRQPEEQIAPMAKQSMMTTPKKSVLATVLAAGTQLLIQVAPVALQVVSQLLEKPRTASTGLGRTSRSNSTPSGGGGRQFRHRQRGRG